MSKKIFSAWFNVRFSKINLRRLVHLCVLQIAVVSSVAVAQVSNKFSGADDSGVYDIVYALPFSVESEFVHNWRAEKQVFTEGTLAVFKVNPELVQPRNGLEPVLYVGDQTVQRISQGDKSGFVLAIIPDAVDLSNAPVWFGRPELPERVTREVIEEELANASKNNFQPFDAKKVDSVTHNSVTVRDLSELLREYGAELIMELSPKEEHLAKSWQLPVAQR